MAKKSSKFQLGIDLQLQNYDSSIKELETLEQVGGSVGKAASKLKKELIETKNSLIALGSTATPQELKKLIRVNADLSSQLEDIATSADNVNIKIERTKAKYLEADQAAKQYKETLDKLEEKQQKLKKENYIGDLASKRIDDKYKAELDRREVGKGKTGREKNNAYWAAIKKDAEGTGEYAEAAKKIVQETTEEWNKNKEKIAAVKNEIAATTKEYNRLKEAAEDYKTALTNLELEKQGLTGVADAARNAADSLDENNNALIRVRDAAVKAGQGQIKLTKSTNETATSFGKAARSVFNYTILYQGLKKVLRESVRTIKEMDDAITGMTVVTSLSREEAWKQVESFQAIAKATSSTMTEIAGLTTEYLKQGRAMKDAKILAEETAKSAKIAGISTAEAVQYMTSAINGFNLAASDATRVSDVFANLAAASATDFEDLAIAVSKVSAQANLAGMSLEYTTALLAKGIETTQEAPESIGTALKTIVARMRELSSYGSVLEDGGSVNKVERALASAGIELRNVNGEFRDLEDIFSELGPKWDYLNTMQQQAIAQAVAGTRQQSRFVAIMQDWGRTQELIAEANASQGASAAQYYEYANGIEAALTRMKTSWEGFVQGLTNNKVIIGAINLATKVIEKINEVPGGLKATIGLYLGIVMINKLRENHEIKMQAYRRMAMSDEEREKQSQKDSLETILNQKKALQQKAELLEANLQLQKSLEQELEKQQNQREHDALRRLELLENEIALRKKDGNDTAELEKERAETIKNIEDMRLARLKERKQLEEEISNIESRKAVNNEWQKRQSKESARDEKIKNADTKIVELEKEKLNTTDSSRIEEINKQITALKQVKTDAEKEFENYIKTGLSSYDSVIDKLAQREKELIADLQKEGLSDEDRQTKTAELESVQTEKGNLTKERDLYRDKDFNSQDIDFGKINEDLDKEKNTRQAKIDVNKSEKEVKLDTAIQAQTKVVESTAEGSAERAAAEAELNELIRQRDELLKSINESDTKNIEFLAEKEVRLTQELASQQEALKLQKEKIKLAEEALGEITPSEEGEKAKARLAEKGYSVDNKEEFAKEAELGIEEDSADIASYQEYLALVEQRQLKEQEIKQLKTEQAALQEQAKLTEAELATMQADSALANTEELSIKQQISALQEQRKTLEAELNAANAYHMSASEQALYTENEAAMQRLELENQILETKKKELEIAKAEAAAQGKSTAKEEKALKKINKTLTKNKKTINKLDQKNKKLADGSLNVYGKMADLIGSKIGINFRGMADNIKTVVDFSKRLVTDFVQLIVPLMARKKGEEAITKEKEKQNQLEGDSTGKTITNIAAKTVENKVEHDITEEDKKQVGLENKTLITAIASLFTKKGQAKAEKEVTKEKKKGFFEGLKNAIANIGSSAGQPYGIGLPFAIAGLAILALAGISGAGINLSGLGGQSKEQKVAAKQNANYEMKKENAKAEKSLDEYNKLRGKEFKTEDDEKRIEELESEMQELDETFAGMRGDQLAKAVMTKVAAQRAAIKQNIDDNFKTTTKMKNVSDSEVARQAIADKMINQQEELIRSNREIAELDQAQVDAITNNATDMANAIAQNVDWSEIYDTKKERKNELEDDLREFNDAAVKMSSAMETAEGDIRSQLKAYNEGINSLEEALEGTTDGFKDAAMDVVKSQYRSLQYISEMNAASNGELIKSIESIVDKTDGAITEEAIVKFSDTIINSTEETADQIALAQSSYDGKSFGKARGNFLGIGGGRGVGGHVKGAKSDRDLEELYDAFDLSGADRNVAKLQEEMGKHIKVNSDGTLKKDKNGNYAFKATGHQLSGNNKHLTEIYKNVTAAVEAQGEYAHLTKEQLDSLEEYNNTVKDAKERLKEALDNINKTLLDRADLLDANTTELDKATGNAGYAFMTSARQAAEEILSAAEDTIATYQADIDALNPENEEDKKKIDALKESMELARSQAHEDANEILQAAQEAVGYLADSDWVNRAESLISKRDNIQDIYDALLEDEELTTEQTLTLFNDIIPDIQAIKPGYSTKELKEIFSEGGTDAMALLREYLNNFMDTSNLVALNSIGVNFEAIESSLKKLQDAGFTQEGFTPTYIDNGSGKKVLDLNSLETLDFTAITEKAKEEGIEWDDEWATFQEAYDTYYKNEMLYEASKKELEAQEQLTIEQIKRANLEAQIARINEDSSKHRLSAIELELEYNKALSDELSNQVNLEKKKWQEELARWNIDFDKLITIENGQVSIAEDVYNSLDPALKAWVTSNQDALKDIVADQYEVSKTIIELEEEKFDELLDLQEEFIDAYTTKLEKEQEVVEESLEKRKELYQEYFDWLNEQDDEEEQENDIEILRQRIANLAGASDAASLKALKDAQEELEELEKESIQSEQERIQEQILANLDKQSEQVEEYYEQQLADNQAIIEAIRKLSDEEKIKLLKQADDYENQTTEKQAELDQKYTQMLDGSSYAAYNRWLAKNQDLSEEEKLEKRKEMLGYSEGGLVDYTGTAIVHGTPGKPEAFLNAEQTALFGKLGETLVMMSSQGLFGRINDMAASTINNNLTIENFDITINADMKDDQDIYNTGQSLADVFFERIQASGIPVNIKR